MELNLHLKATAVFKKQRATHLPLQLQERIQHLLVNLSVFKTVCKNEILLYLDNFCIRDIRTDTMLQTLDQPHKILKNERLRAAPDKTFFFPKSALFLGHQLQNGHRQPLKYKLD